MKLSRKALTGAVLAIGVMLAGCGLDRLVVHDGGIVSGTGTVRYVTIEGGFYAIAGDDHQSYDPINLPADLRVDGQRVQFKARVCDDLVSVHMTGPIVEILQIAKQ